MAALKKIAAGHYVTADGRYVIASDCPSLGDREDFQGRVIAYEAPRATEWFVYVNNERVQRGDFGPPDALVDGFTTRREAQEWTERN